MPTQFLTIIDILGTFAFAISGALLAMQKRLDIFGVVVMAFVTAIGGGTIRDILIGNFPVSWLMNETAAIVIFIAVGVSFFFGNYVRKFPVTLFIFDALGLGLFTVVGIEMGLSKGLSEGICVALGAITGCFGGVIRDVLLNQVPMIFRKEIYALACIIGGLVYFLLLHLNLYSNFSNIICMIVVFTIRVVAVRYKISLPTNYR